MKLFTGTLLAVAGIVAMLCTPLAAEEDPESCHGPLYFTLKDDEKKQLAAEAARVLVEKFFNRTGQQLEKTRRAEWTRLKAAKTARFVECLQETKRPSLLCTLMAARQEEWCGDLLLEAQRETCRQVVPPARVLAAADSGQCKRLKNADGRQLCTFVVSGSYSCGEMASPSYAAACRAVQAIRSGQDLPLGGMSKQELATASWAMAMVNKDPSWCERNPFSGYIDACKALVVGASTHCPPVRPTVEHFDLDYSCRDVVMYEAIRQVEGGRELVATVGSAYPGKAQCDLRLRVLRKGETVVQAVDRVSVGHRAGWRTVRYFVENGEIEGLDASCNWDRTSAVFWLEGATSDW